ncbi:MAG: transporter substrate-binding domain-containing protein [Burkholderiales bacterium]|nr:MAG: transporter substrate-binding domain-containing protein [Burkholderiales bacterium]
MRRRDALLLPALALMAGIAVGQRRTVVIGAEDDWYPYSAEVQGRPEGITIELVTAAFRAVGVDVQLISLPYVRCMAQTKAGTLLACFNTTRTALIEEDYAWPARPMFDERFLIWARADAPSPRAGGLQVHDLEGEQVAVTRGYEYGTEFDSNPRIVRVVTSHDETNFRLLLRGRATYTLAPDINARLLFKRQPDLAGKFKVVGQLSAYGLYTAFSRRHPQTTEMLAAFDEGMKVIHANGVAKAIHERWRQRAGAP